MSRIESRLQMFTCHQDKNTGLMLAFVCSSIACASQHCTEFNASTPATSPALRESTGTARWRSVGSFRSVSSRSVRTIGCGEQSARERKGRLSSWFAGLMAHGYRSTSPSTNIDQSQKQEAAALRRKRRDLFDPCRQRLLNKLQQEPSGDAEFDLAVVGKAFFEATPRCCHGCASSITVSLACAIS